MLEKERGWKLETFNKIFPFPAFVLKSTEQIDERPCCRCDGQSEGGGERVKEKADYRDVQESE